MSNKACLQWQPKAKDISWHEGGHCSLRHGWPYAVWGTTHRGAQVSDSFSPTIVISQSAAAQQDHPVINNQRKKGPSSQWELSTCLQVCRTAKVQPQAVVRCKLKGQKIAQKGDCKILYIQHAHGLWYNSSVTLFALMRHSVMCAVSLEVLKN